MSREHAFRKLSDPGEVARQYRDSANFDARVRLYERFGTNPQSLLAWLFERIDLSAHGRVLELGCGTGNLWLENRTRIPKDAEIALSDLSPGMLAAAQRRLADVADRFVWYRLDAQAIPFADDAFDVVLANHMLYHVPDRARALAEGQRVLRPGGCLHAVTNAWTHLIELRELCERFGLRTMMRPPRPVADFFDVETAAEEIAAAFGNVRAERYDNALEVTDAEPLVDYLLSVNDATRRTDPQLRRLVESVERQIERLGSFRIGATAGLLTAVKCTAG